MIVDLSKLVFYSGVNYLKRSDFCGSTSLTLPSYGNTVSHTVTHNLGYIPYYQVFVKSDATNTIWSPFKIDKYTDTSSSGVDPAVPFLRSWITTTELVITLQNSTDPVATGTRDIFWIIYLDYEV